MKYWWTYKPKNIGMTYEYLYKKLQDHYINNILKY